MNAYDELKKHQRNVMKICGVIGLQLELSYYEYTYLLISAYYHDIGKLQVPLYILTKPDILSIEEWNIMKKHVLYGRNILKRYGYENSILDNVYYHHEKYNGSGYPKGLKGTEIPLCSRIISIADAYDVMISERPYKKAMPQKTALTEICNNAGRQFDPYLCEVFLNNIYKLNINEKKGGKSKTIIKLSDCFADI